ncbi:styrene monooxygenase/indole monooxygenase family protein [Streptomyces sp. NRRL F-2799]|uniref:styrene monooxygenase/indole monooxygenase family protein n=1 Tax=Streptomyces sp. NRRL F-2799 TaxID=1463844 RepID=UPI0004CB4012|nr:styrene monooxygenase/indole monooxygenase family protein [Streptomyces sp. NRRL F-2799]
MRRIAVIGAGQAGAQLALGLQAHGYDVTLVTDRGPDEIRRGPVMSSQCMFDTAMRSERELGLHHWEERAPEISGIAFSLIGPHGTPDVSWRAPLEGPAHSVDQRVKCAAWIEQFAAGDHGEIVLHEAGVEDLEWYARTHDLVVVSTGKGELSRLFPRDAELSPYDRPRRALALTYVTGTAPREGEAAVHYRMVPGVGEYFTFPALTTTGPCEIMVFEGVPGGPMDCWDDIRTPEGHLTRSLEILHRFFPDEYDRCRHARLTDEGGVLRGRLTPTVRHPVARLASGRHVLGMADAVVLNDPITGQGSNNAAQAATHYLASILRHGTAEFTPQWMRRTFDNFWRGWAQWAVGWTNSLLTDLSPHHRDILTAAAEIPSVAGALAAGFDDPRTLYRWWFEEAEAQRFLAEKRAQHAVRFDGRELRRALGQYATGVTVVTARAPDGRNVGMTANSFTSVSLDPPLVLWCPGKNSPSLPDFTDASHFAVHVLAADQHHLSRQFATPADDKFRGTPTTPGIAGTPLLDGAVARFQCRTVQRVDAGDHIIFLGEVEEYEADGGAPLVFHSGYYHVATKHPDL